MRRGKWISAGLLACSLLNLTPTVRAAGENVRLYGTLVAEPCVLKPGDENVAIDFGRIVDKYLYTNGRTPSTPFQLHLQECDLSIGKQVSVTFSGQESDTLPGLLAVAPAGSGIAIGITDGQGIPIAVNSPSGKFTLKKGDITLEFASFVQARPDSITHHTIARQSFSATATFRLDYE